ncbi:YppG family protein [Bacillus xiapuensis]|uniref:YppG family protein n=1 Tax=Bacillus xiapuensis TaxID=2014075 RepID=UPI0012FDA92F|nr:YppG family protein [Bacillus xiapuensis]
MNHWGPMPMQPYPYEYYPQLQAHPYFYPQPADQSSFAGSLFDHPLYTMHQPQQPYMPFSAPSAPNMNKPPASGNMFIKSFQNEDGSFNMNKALDTAGLMMNTVSQLSSIVKGVSGWLKV